MKYPQVIYRALRSMDKGFKTTDPVYPIAAILLASVTQGANVDLVADYLKLPLEDVALVASRLWRNGIWMGNQLTSSWNEKPDNEDSGLEFWLDVHVGAGNLERGMRADGAITYKMNDDGVKYVEAKFSPEFLEKFVTRMDVKKVGQQSISHQAAGKTTPPDKTASDR